MPANARPEPSALTKEVAAIMKGLLARRGVEQQALAAAIGISNAQMSRMLSGQKHWDVDNLSLACDFLDADWTAVLVDAKETVRSREQAASPTNVGTSTDHEDYDASPADLERADYDLVAKRGRKKADTDHAE